MAGIVAFRDFEILSKTGKTLISGTSSWSQVNLKTRRPMRIDLVVDNNTLPDKHAMEKRAEKIVNPADLLWHDPLQVRSSHIDVNWHVNNTQYLDWIINELPIEWIKDKTLARIGINFLAEGKLNDIVSVGLSHSSELEWSACVRRDGNNGDLCRVKLTFAERN